MVDEKRIKVTDKRMFTADGELREEFRDLGGEAGQGVSDSTSESSASAQKVETPPIEASGPSTSERDAPRIELPPTGQGLAQPTFFDLVGLLAQPIALYLGDVKLPDGESAENLELARLHIDLLEILRQKTSGSLTVQELGFLDDLLYQLRLRYVQKRG